MALFGLLIYLLELLLLCFGFLACYHKLAEDSFVAFSSSFLLFNSRWALICSKVPFCGCSEEAAVNLCEERIGSFQEANTSLKVTRSMALFDCPAK